MKILGDINQSIGSHGISHFPMHRKITQISGEEIEFIPLAFGDYVLGTPELMETVKRRGDKLKKIDTAADVKCAVDFKANLSEVAMNITGGKKNHDRFIDELILAQKNGVKFYILIQEDSKYKSVRDVFRWVNPRAKAYYFQKARAERMGQKPKYSKPPVNGETLAKSMLTIELKYGCKFVFTTGIEAAQTIIDLLTEGNDGNK